MAPTTSIPTKEQIEAALAHFDRIKRLGAWPPNDLVHVETILSAVPALTAELEQERGTCNALAEQLRGLAEVLDKTREERNTERNAHEETRREADRLQRLLDAQVTRRANAEAESQAWRQATGRSSPEAYQSAASGIGHGLAEAGAKRVVASYRAVATIPDLDERDRLDALRAINASFGARGGWALDEEVPPDVVAAHQRFARVAQTHAVVDVHADGTRTLRLAADAFFGDDLTRPASATPEAYRASVEPTGDLVEDLSGVAWAAEAKEDPSLRDFGEWPDAPEDVRRYVRAGIRAVVRELAARGEGVAPSAEECLAEQYRRFGRFVADPLTPHRAARDLILFRLAPVLGARRALVPTEEEVAQRIHEVRRSRATAACERNPAGKYLLPPERLSDCGTGMCADALDEARAVIELFQRGTEPTTDEELAEKTCSHPRNSKQYGADGNSWICGACGAWQGERER